MASLKNDGYQFCRHMTLVTTKSMLKNAQAGGYAVGHFNTSNLEFSQAIISAAEEMNSPVIVATSKSAIVYAGFDNLGATVRNLARKATVPVALHLDHGPNFSYVRECVKHGWTSIMRDASACPFKQNVREIQKTVRFCHRHRIPVEAELGMLKGEEGWVRSEEHVFTDPDEAREFVRLTNCDSLAISVGTSHGVYKFSGTPKLDLKRLSEIADKVNVPLVLHGASSEPLELIESANKFGAQLKGVKGVPEKQIKEAIKRGICKVNTDTDLRLEFLESLRAYLKLNPKVIDPRKILGDARNELRKHVERRMKMLGSVGRV